MFRTIVIYAIFPIFLICMSLQIPVSAAVRTVGPGGDFPEIQEAVDASYDGDVVLVYSGTYGPVVIVYHGISIVADTNAEVTVVGGFDIKNTFSYQTMVLSGLKGQCNYWDERHTLILENNQASIRIENCEWIGNDGYSLIHTYHSHSGVRISHCEDIAIIDSNIKGGDAVDSNTGPSALRATDSTIAIYDSVLTGGDGGDAANYAAGGGDGGAGFRCDTGLLFASGCLFQGGDGGYGADANDCFGAGNGGDGGHGIWITTDQADAWLLDNECNGGKGGQGGAGWGWFPPGKPGSPGDPILAEPGTVYEFPGQAHKFAIPSPIRENEIFSMNFKGIPESVTGLFVAAEPDSKLIHAFKGQFLLSISPMPLFYYAGLLDPVTGELELEIRAPELDPGMASLNIYIQSIFSDPSSDVVLGTARTVTELDEGY
jgi:hypothetical protein